MTDQGPGPSGFDWVAVVFLVVVVVLLIAALLVKACWV